MEASQEKSEYELKREQNILKMRETLGFNYNPDAIPVPVKPVHNPPKEKTVVRKRRSNDPTFQARISSSPQVQRQSFRLAKKPPLYNYEALQSEDDLSDNDSEPDASIEGYVKSLQKVVYPSKRRKSTSAFHPVVDGFRVREFSQHDINNIAKRSSDKKRSINSGSTCHQCRQHTLDTKSFCHNTQCVGINGQLCGPCLLVRYGEDVETTLKNPKWICPFCRGICNCSFCRRRSGRLPTGILAHVATKQGFKSVHHLLNLSNNGDEEDKENQSDENENNSSLEEKNSGNKENMESEGKVVENVMDDSDIKKHTVVTQDGARDTVEKTMEDDEIEEKTCGTINEEKINSGGEEGFGSEAKTNAETVLQYGIKGEVEKMMGDDKGEEGYEKDVGDERYKLVETVPEGINDGVENTENCLLGFDADLKPVMRRY